MDRKTISELASFIKGAPTAFHAVEKMSLRSVKNGSLSRGRGTMSQETIPASLPSRREMSLRITAFM